MSTLFFEGFDRGLFLRRLDPNYWSSQYYQNPPYAFGGYTYSNDTISISNTYTRIYGTYSPNRGVLPSGSYYPDQTVVGSQVAGNDYPGFGEPPGFLAITNRRINDNTDLDPIAYLQLSGFPITQGNRSYFGMRVLGVETKHEDYWNVTSPPGRFGYAHPLIAFCSGNITGLLVNVIAITGNNLLPLITEDPVNNNEGKRISIGLEISQNNTITGIFDLNLSDTLNNYRITPIYCAEFSPIKIPPSDPCKLLTIADTDSGPYSSSIVSRWTHFEFEIDHISGTLKIKTEGTDTLIFNDNELREFWEIALPISGFRFDNIRFFNRTYFNGSECYYPPYTEYIGRQNSLYYGLGAVTLFDDITLVDSSGNIPNFFLGHDSKVIPLHPGIGSSNVLVDQPNFQDGIFGWSKFGNRSYRATVASLDKDTTHLYSSSAGSINAIVYSNINNSTFYDSDSLWRVSYNDGIGGLKVYNNARKSFLDTGFVNVVRTGITDIDPEKTILLLHAEENPVLDYSLYGHQIDSNGSTSIVSDRVFGNSGINFVDNQSYLVALSDKDFNSGVFTIESWIKLNNANDKITLFDRRYNSNFTNYSINGSVIGATNDIRGYTFSCTTGAVSLEVFYTYSVLVNEFNYVNVGCSTPARLILPLPSAIPTGQWAHIAITRNKNNTNPVSGWFTVFLNGSSGTGYQLSNIPTLTFGYTQFADCPGTNSSNLISGPLYFDSDPKEFQESVYNILFSTLQSKITNNISMPYTYIGGAGYMDEYRVSTGIVRYTSNFTVPNNPFPSPTDDYIEIGPKFNLDRSSYRMFQYYQMYNPATNQPWSTSQIVESGLILGVKKL
jgi:hypothetical protein